MQDILRDAAEYLATQEENLRGRSVTYSRKIGATVYSVPVVATVGTTVFKQTDTTGKTRIEFGERDYLIRANVIVINGETVKPARGDRITDATNGEVYEVSAPGGEPPWRKSDPDGIRLRIHCKQVG